MCWVLLLMRDATNAAPGGWREGLEAVIVKEIMPLLPGLLKEDELFPLWAVRVAAECLQGMPDLATAALKRYLVRPLIHPGIMLPRSTLQMGFQFRGSVQGIYYFLKSVRIAFSALVLSLPTGSPDMEI